MGFGFIVGPCSAFSKIQFPPELQRVLSCKSPVVFLHFPLEEKGPLLSAPAGASKRDTPTLNLTESTECVFQGKREVKVQSLIEWMGHFASYMR